MLHAVVMAGGSGTRFWPESRRNLPKQFLPLSGIGPRTLLQETFDRCVPWIPADRFHVVTNAAHAAETLRQLPELPPQNLLLEPCGRNTAPCVGLAAMHVRQQDPEAVMLVMPADHGIRPVETFQAAAERAAGIVAESPCTFALFGVPPSYPSTGFGYIERGAPLPGPRGAYAVQSFREKPNKATAEEFLQSGRYYWNCGIFVWQAQAILDALAEFQPEIQQRLQRLAPAWGTAGREAALRAEFPGMPSISIDHAVLETARQVAVIEAPFEWDDVGSWHAIARLKGADAAGNTAEGSHACVATQNCIIRTSPEHLVTTIGMTDCIVVHTPDATLVANRNDENAIRQLIALLEEKGYARFL